MPMTENESEALRKIIHVDMDAFYASVEQRDRPELRGKPVAVGGSSKRGVVAAASYEARTYGVRSAMPSISALRRCPDLIFVKPRFDVYRAVSRQIREIFARHTDIIEPLALDEAYLDVTRDKQGIGSAVKIARQIRAAIREETGLTASAGVSYNKFIAKIASDQNKPDGLCIILPDEGAGFVATLPVRRFHGVGPRTAEKMERLGIRTGADLAAMSEEWLARNFGSSAGYLYKAARGIDDRPVNPSRARKSIGGELTYSQDKQTNAELRAALDEIIEIVWRRIETSGVSGRSIVLKARYADFRTLTRSRTLPHAIAAKEEFAALGHVLLNQLLPASMGVRLLGLTLSGIEGSSDDQRSSAPEAPFIGEQQKLPLEFVED